MFVLFLDDSGGARAPLAEALLRQMAPWHEALGAGWVSSFVRTQVREVLEEAGVKVDVLRSHAVRAVVLEDVDLVVSFVADEGPLRLRPGTRRLSWLLPDPLAAPPSERLEAFRAARDEIERRLKILLKELE